MGRKPAQQAGAFDRRTHGSARIVIGRSPINPHPAAGMKMPAGVCRTAPAKEGLMQWLTYRTG